MQPRQRDRRGRDDDDAHDLREGARDQLVHDPREGNRDDVAGPAGALAHHDRGRPDGLDEQLLQRRRHEADVPEGRGQGLPERDGSRVQQGRADRLPAGHGEPVHVQPEDDRRADVGLRRSRERLRRGSAVERLQDVGHLAAEHELRARVHGQLHQGRRHHGDRDRRSTSRTRRWPRITTRRRRT